jgi:acylphosphatase
MVERIFFIEGDGVTDVGMRIALIELGGNFGVNIHAANMTEYRVRVIASGEIRSIAELRDYIINNDIRIKKDVTKYVVTESQEYDGPEIDWNRYQMLFMSSQMSKGFREATNKLSSIDIKLDTMDKKFGVIGDTLQRIDGKLPETSS